MKVIVKLELDTILDDRITLKSIADVISNLKHSLPQCTDDLIGLISTKVIDIQIGR